MADIRRVADPPGGWTYEAHPPADEWMIDNYDENRITLSIEQAKEFEERAKRAGFTIARFP